MCNAYYSAAFACNVSYKYFISICFSIFSSLHKDGEIKNTCFNARSYFHGIFCGVSWTVFVSQESCPRRFCPLWRFNCKTQRLGHQGEITFLGTGFAVAFLRGQGWYEAICGNFYLTDQVNHTQREKIKRPIYLYTQTLCSFSWNYSQRIQSVWLNLSKKCADELHKRTSSGECPTHCVWKS